MEAETHNTTHTFKHTHGRTHKIDFILFCSLFLCFSNCDRSWSLNISWPQEMWKVSFYNWDEINSFFFYNKYEFPFLYRQGKRKKWHTQSRDFCTEFIERFVALMLDYRIVWNRNAFLAAHKTKRGVKCANGRLSPKHWLTASGQRSCCAANSVLLSVCRVYEMKIICSLLEVEKLETKWQFYLNYH